MSTAPAARLGQVSGFDVTTPNIARVHDFRLGGKDHFAADRAGAGRLLQIHSQLPQLAPENRLFLGRAVRWLARQGVRQFLDIGSGLPTAETRARPHRRWTRAGSCTPISTRWS
jgi:hypothetical protein